ncbi:YkgJ family cysteine cluster protein [Methanoregula sp.]|uniref:YkgJ family cysteine cluster protein n=1 Tax=Methanoregula sp. TaxID=2052170 RepID=UPI00356641FA
MAIFECNFCGRCCMSFGKLIRIERQVSGQDYFCRDKTTDELFQAHVLPEFADEIEEEFSEPGKGNPQVTSPFCIFQKKDPGGRGYTCAIYPTRPGICRTFTCYRMLIYHRESGEVRGRVIGSRELRTGDARLQEIWKNEIECLPSPTRLQCAGSPESANHNSRLHARIAGSTAPDDRGWVGRVQTILTSHGYNGDPVE